MLNFQDTKFTTEPSEVNGLPAVRLTASFELRGGCYIDHRMIEAANFSYVEAEKQSIRNLMWGIAYGDLWADAMRVYEAIQKSEPETRKYLTSCLQPLMDKLAM